MLRSMGWVPWLVTMAGLVTILIGFLMLCWSLYQVHLAHDWRPVKVLITNAQLGTTHVFSRGSSGVRYVPEVSYRYVVAGQTYRSERVYPGPGDEWADHEAAEEAMARAGHIGGETADGYYDARDPSYAVLIPEGRYDGRIIIMVMGLMVVGFGWVFKKDDDRRERRLRGELP